MAIKTFPITLQETKMIAARVRQLQFQRNDGEVFDFKPGQFITIIFSHNDKTLRRSYSIASFPNGTPNIEFAAGYVAEGPATDLLFHLKVGDKLTASGPHGLLVLNEEHPKRYIFIATSTGVTPYRSMMNRLMPLLEETDLKVVLLLGVRTQEDLIYGDEFVAYAKQYDNFEFRAHYSREFPKEPKPHEYRGYVQHSLDSLALNPENDIVYLCGNPNMIDESFDYLKEKSFSPTQIKREKYYSAKTK